MIWNSATEHCKVGGVGGGIVKSTTSSVWTEDQSLSNWSQLCLWRVWGSSNLGEKELLPMTAIYFTVNMRQQWVIKQFYTFLLRNYPQCMQYISIRDLNKIVDLVIKIF